MIILGAGLAGLLAGNMLRRFNPMIYEAQPSLPNNHAALLRFRTDAASIAFSIPFKKVKVHKAVSYRNKMFNSPSLQLMNMYSEKVTGEYMGRSLDDMRPVERYIAPMDLISQASTQLKIEFNRSWSWPKQQAMPKEEIISTIPMDMMMGLVRYHDQPEFKYLPIWSIKTKVSKPCNLYQTIYYPGSEPYYRCSITGDDLIIECIEPTQAVAEDICNKVLEDFGIYGGVGKVEVKHQKYGKLLPIDDGIRKRFILHLTEEYGIYSLGRFATWRQILLDDVVNDVNVIEGLMNMTGYERRNRSVA
jgi:hypothetical protein